MGIDWFTVVVQIINFLILVWLLKKFLYKPILGAMERREQSIAKRLQDAAEQQKQALAEKAKYLEMQKSLEQAARSELEKVRNEADELRARLVKDARLEGESARSQWHKAVEEEKNTFLEQTTKAMAQHFEQLARAVLNNLADEALQNKITGAFLRRIDLLPPEDLQGLRTAAAAGEQAVITSAFTLSEEVKKEINRCLAKVLCPDIQVQFKQDRELVAGLYLTIGNKKVRWDIQQYLKEFQDELSKSLNREMMR